MTASLRRRFAAVAAFLAAAVILGVPASPAGAEPNEGGSKTLREALESSAKGFIEAKQKLANSKKRQLQLRVQLRKLDAEVRELSGDVNVLAANSYRLGRLNGFTALLNSGTPDDFLARAARLDVLAQRDAKKLQDFQLAREEAARTKAAIDLEVQQQRKQVTVMAKRKEEAERALALVGGQATGGFVSVNSPAARPAPRNSDGSFPGESCVVDDPTTSGCITPRTLHALQQARAAGFNRHTSCFRSGGSGEHPLGRACDYSAAPGGFENVHATGGDRTYGNNVAAYFVRNADRLGVLYVIWYRQIWMPATGWRAYSNGGDPASAHTNHVHLSML